MIKVAALWEHKDKNGKIFYTGKFGDASVIILPNGFKKESNQPDYNLFITPPRKKDTEPMIKSETSFDIF